MDMCTTLRKEGAQTGLVTVNGKLYYFGTNGVQQTGIISWMGKNTIFNQKMVVPQRFDNRKWIYLLF